MNVKEENNFHLTPENLLGIFCMRKGKNLVMEPDLQD